MRGFWVKDPGLDFSFFGIRVSKAGRAWQGIAALGFPCLGFGKFVGFGSALEPQPLNPKPPNFSPKTGFCNSDTPTLQFFVGGHGVWFDNVQGVGLGRFRV